MFLRALGCPAKLRLYAFIFFVLLSGAVKAQIPPVGVNTTKTASCNLANGELTVVANYGAGPYYFFIDGAGPYTSGTNIYVFTGLAGSATGITYTFLVYDGSGTPVTAFGLMGNLAPPTVSGVATAATCLNNDGALVINTTGGTSPFVYKIGTVISSSPRFTGLASGGVTATVTDALGCVVPATFVIPLKNDLTLKVGADFAICEGTSAPLPAVSNGLQFTWTPATGLSDPNVLNPLASPVTATRYNLSVVRGICGLGGSILVSVNPAPTADAGLDDQTCFGKSVFLQGSGAGAGGTYHWSPSTYLNNTDIPFPIVTRPLSTITYNLSVTDVNKCTSLQTDAVTITVTPPVLVVASPHDTTVFAGQPVPLLATGPVDPGGSSYLWSPATGISNPLIKNPVATVSVPQVVTYTVQLTTSGGCAGTDTATVRAFAVADIFVPNAFSPNGDGHNDVLRPIVPGIVSLKFFTVFGRFGQQVFTTNNMGVGWDGSVNGRLVEAGVYVWMAMGVDVSGRVVERRGTVLVVR